VLPSLLILLFLLLLMVVLVVLVGQKASKTRTLVLTEVLLSP
jgi:hypothetical protein